MTQPESLVNRLWRLLGKRFAPPAFVLFLLVLGMVTAGGYFLLGWRLATAVVCGFDAAVIAFVIALLPLGRDHCEADMRRHADQNDANRTTVLVATMLVTLVLLVTMIAELPNAQKGESYAKALLIVTLGLSWIFTNVVFMLHYAHMNYSQDEKGKNIRGGFDFPGTPEPDYWDFLYFSLTAGMSFAASDVNVTSKPVRRVVVWQCLLSFIFNIGALAFCINVLAGSN